MGVWVGGCDVSHRQEDDGMVEVEVEEVEGGNGC